MDPNFLDFEQLIADLQAEIEELRLVGDDNALNISDEISCLQDKSRTLAENIFGNLFSWQIAQLAHHPKRPYTLDYIGYLFSDFKGLHGDRHFADDSAIVGGVARLDGSSVIVISHQKDHEIRKKIWHNFDIPRPEGYHKAYRLMEMAERFEMPILTLIDTPGACPGIGAEERGQSGAVVWNLWVVVRLKMPTIATVIGEGGSGGALVTGACDQLNILQCSTYSVISPRGCALILWRTVEKAPEAVKAMGIAAERLKDLGIVNEVIGESLGDAHRDPASMAESIHGELLAQLKMPQGPEMGESLERRYDRLMGYGAP